MSIVILFFLLKILLYNFKKITLAHQLLLNYNLIHIHSHDHCVYIYVIRLWDLFILPSIPTKLVSKEN